MRGSRRCKSIVFSTILAGTTLLFARPQGPPPRDGERIPAVRKGGAIAIPAHAPFAPCRELEDGCPSGEALECDQLSWNLYEAQDWSRGTTDCQRPRAGAGSPDGSY